MNRSLLLTATAVAVLGLTACSSDAPKPAAATPAAETKKEAAPAKALSGKDAFYEMFDAAHTWAPDIVALSLTSGTVTGIENADGKAGVWTAVFASPSLKQQRTYTWAAAEQLPNIQKGVKAESAEAWGGPTAAVTPFSGSDVTVDSDAAYKTVAEKAAAWLKDNPGKKVSISLGFATRFPAPVWYIIWGDTKSGFFQFVNAATGNIVTK